MLIKVLSGIIKISVVKTLAELLYYPFWWYGAGLWSVVKYFGRWLAEKYQTLAIRILLRNFFKPMYGVDDFAGRMISLFARALILAWRLGIWFLWLIGCLCLMAAWIGAPALAVYQLWHLYFFS